MLNRDEFEKKRESRRNGKLVDQLCDIARALQVQPKHPDVMAELYAMVGRNVTQNRRIKELEDDLQSEKAKEVRLNTPRGLEAYDSKADCTLQADIEALKQAQIATDACLAQQVKDFTGLIDCLAVRLADLEFAASPKVYDPHRITAAQTCAIRNFNGAVTQQIDREMLPGGLLYGLKK